ncbi:hypothetical protein DFH28DRAFT_923470 [Melampsora americana]|nr:hypothetical protein DFH28DRAFT_923470 [Melampsora americana]
MAVIDYMEQQAADEDIQPAAANRDLTPALDLDQGVDHDDHMSSPPRRPLSPLSLLRSLGDSDQPHSAGYDSDSSDDLTIESVRRALEALHTFDSTDESEDEASEEALEEELRSGKIQDAIDWFPFKKKEHVLALLLMGSARGLLSREQYERCRLVFRLCDVSLPDWGVLRALISRMKERVGLELSERMSPDGKPLFGLKVETIIRQVAVGLTLLCVQELANPMISPHIVFLPEEPMESPVTRFSQCQKWREAYAPDLRVQMIATKERHFYIYEPVQLVSQQLVVPMFFFQRNGTILARCMPATVVADPGDSAYHKVIVSEDPPFDSPDFFTIKCDDFWKTFDEIELYRGCTLKSKSRDQLYYRSPMGVASHPIENQWRQKAQGKVIRHVPITLYSDDTSGNVSKKWNKHMSLYFTLSGLSPAFTNQEFNIHFLATSNCASALDLLDKVVDDINDLAVNGMVAYDHTLGEDVLAMVVVLCHLGDSPMHAEISNTLNPANTLTPCRMCDLQVKKMVDKQTAKYLRDFLGLDENYRQAHLAKRDWSETKRLSHQIWKTAQNKYSKTLVENMIRDYGVRDTMSDYFIKMVQKAHDSRPPEVVEGICKDLDADLGERIFNPMLRLKGFDGHADTPVETLHVVLLGITKYLFRDLMKGLPSTKIGSPCYNDISARWRSFNTKGLNIPPINPNTLIQFYQSLVGKDFRTVLQTVPFVVFDHIPPEKRHVWTSLCLLGSYIFQTEIPDMERYLNELEIIIDSFLHLLISLSAQWVNKPKFHMLVHLKQSIRRFGPACLFATEKFESFNGVLRQASVHSNSLSPGRDIANTFTTRAMMRMFICASSFFDKDLQCRVVPGVNLRTLFATVPDLFPAMRHEKSRGNPDTFKMGLKCNSPYRLPLCLPAVNPGKAFECFQHVTLENGQKVEANNFVLLKSDATIAQILSIWKVEDESPSKCVLIFKKCVAGRMLGFYAMREILVTDEVVCKSVKDIERLLNLQHNCHEGRCPATKTHLQSLERKEAQEKLYILTHAASNSYVLNSAAHYSGAVHRNLSQYNLPRVTPEEWHQAITQGISKWIDEALRAGRAKKAPARKGPARRGVQGPNTSANLMY